MKLWIISILCTFCADSFIHSPIQNRPLWRPHDAPFQWMLVSMQGRVDPNEEALERLRRLENIVLKVVAQQADKIKSMEARVNGMERRYELLYAELKALRLRLLADAAETKEFELAELSDLAEAAERDAARLRELAIDTAVGTLAGALLRNDRMAPAKPEPGGAEMDADTERRIVEARRFEETLDVPGDLFDAADAAGAAVLSCMLAGHRRILVEVEDPLLDDATPDRDEQLALAVELIILPIAAALEGLEIMERNHVKLQFRTIGQLVAAKRALTVVTVSKTVSMSALHLEVDERDAVIVLVTPKVEAESDPEDLKKLVKASENCTIIMVNPWTAPSQKSSRALIDTFEVGYVVQPFTVSYMAQAEAAPLGDEADMAKLLLRQDAVEEDKTTIFMYEDEEDDEFEYEGDGADEEEGGMELGVLILSADDDVTIKPDQDKSCEVSPLIRQVRNFTSAAGGWTPGGGTTGDWWAGADINALPDRMDGCHVSEARVTVLREYPTQWRAFVQMTQDTSESSEQSPVEKARVDGMEEEDTKYSSLFEEMREQPWQLAKRFPKRPSKQEVGLAIMHYLAKVVHGEEGEHNFGEGGNESSVVVL